METPLTPLEFMRRTRRLHPTREAVVDGEMRLTYAQFFDRCDRWSTVLQRRFGVGRGDRVATIAPNTHAQLESFYAAPQIGAVVVPINYRLIADDFADRTVRRCAGKRREQRVPILAADGREARRRQFEVPRPEPVRELPDMGAGHMHDSDTGLMYAGARYYDPRQAQWLSADPILAEYWRGAPGGGVFMPGHLALFSYVLQNPTRGVVEDAVGRVVGQHRQPLARPAHGALVPGAEVHRAAVMNPAPVLGADEIA